MEGVAPRKPFSPSRPSPHLTSNLVSVKLYSGIFHQNDQRLIVRMALFVLNIWTESNMIIFIVKDKRWRNRLIKRLAGLLQLDPKAITWALMGLLCAVQAPTWRSMTAEC